MARRTSLRNYFLRKPNAILKLECSIPTAPKQKEHSK